MPETDKYPPLQRISRMRSCMEASYSVEEVRSLFFEIDPSNFWKIRLHIHDIPKKEYKAQLNDYKSNNPVRLFLVREHEANRVHLQGLLWCSKGESTIRNAIKSSFPWAKGNSGYSLSPCMSKKEPKPDILNYIQYCCKGASEAKQPEVKKCDFKLLEHDQLGEQCGSIIFRLHALYWEENKKLNKENPKKYKKSLKTKVLEHFTQEQLDTITTMSHSNISQTRWLYKEISLIVRHKLHRSATPISMTNLVFNILMDQNPKFENWHYENKEFFWLN